MAKLNYITVRNAKLLHQKLLILDLDETLIHATEQPLEHETDFRTELYHVYKRPHVEAFLEFCQENFLVGVWTTSGKDFAEIVVKSVFLRNYLLQFLWSRERCTRAYNPNTMETYYIKNLSKLKRQGYRLENIIMVDDTPMKLQKNYGNLIRIEEWLGNSEDKELLRLMKYLADLKEVENIRTVEKRGWQIYYTL